MNRFHDFPRRSAAFALALALVATAVAAQTGPEASPLPFPASLPAVPAGHQPTPEPVSSPAAAAAEPVSPLRLEINVPAYRLDAYVGEERVASYLVTPGKPAEPTDPGRYEIRSVIWNPWWHPPAHRRPKDRVTPPGPRNPMGRVKLNLRGLYFIHGTALDKEIGRPVSRGCVRLRNEDAVSLARLVHRYAGHPLPPGELDALARNARRTRALQLAVPVPVQIVYRLAEVHRGRLTVHPDIYRLATRPLADLAADALAASGVPAERVDRAALAGALAASSPIRGLPIESVLLPDGGAATEALSLDPAGVAVSRAEPAGE
jgi:lipoprotein-anchoring transpeptidase ErfK/SrfK